MKVKPYSQSKYPLIFVTMYYPTDTILQYLSSIKPELAENYQVVRLGLFGSYAAQTQTENSDIDILIEFSEKTDDIFTKKQYIREKLAEHFHKKIDLCREKYIKEYFKEHILKHTIYV